MSTDDGLTREDLAAALDSDPASSAAFRKLQPSRRREYLEWIDGAKRSATRRRRIDKTIRILHA